ncbi:hypothetical protein NXZ77_18530 [Lysinibacillus boronitolerans]|nr:hypothetical protein [Lysinibacillus boronitolerans]MCS1393570.1 hypothetical protein [Lysinibacillus boronitolerans]
MASSIFNTDVSVKMVVESGTHKSEVEIFKNKVTIQAKVIEMKKDG